MSPSVLLVLALAACTVATAPDFDEFTGDGPSIEKCCHCVTGLDRSVTKIEAIGNMKARVTIKPTYGTCTGPDRKHF